VLFEPPLCLYGFHELPESEKFHISAVPLVVVVLRITAGAENSPQNCRVRYFVYEEKALLSLKGQSHQTLDYILGSRKLNQYFP
jgi:hypothetical protein